MPCMWKPFCTVVVTDSQRSHRLDRSFAERRCDRLSCDISSQTEERWMRSPSPA